MPQFYVIAPVEFNSAAPTCDCVAHRFGNAADHPERVRRYPSDMTDAEWAVVRPLLPVPGWLRGRGGQPEAYCHRAILDAIRYLVDNGIKWRAMPADFPPWDRVYAFFRRWRDHLLVKEFHDRLRAKVREKVGRDVEPTAGVIDSQSVKADAVVGADSRGFDGGRLVNGRKRHVVVDTLGLLLADLGGHRGPRRRDGPAHPRGGRSPPAGPGLGGWRLHRQSRRALPGHARPGPGGRQAQRRHARLRRASQEVDRGAVLRAPDAKPPSRARLRAIHQHRGSDGLLVDDAAHDPPPCPAATVASVKRPGADSTSQPRPTSRLAFDLSASIFAGTGSRPKQAAISWQVNGP